MHFIWKGNRDKPFECKALINGTQSEEKEKDGDNFDLMLWIFIGITGVLLIFITICICIKCCHNKSNDIIEEFTAELVDKEEEGIIN